MSTSCLSREDVISIEDIAVAAIAAVAFFANVYFLVVADMWKPVRMSDAFKVVFPEFVNQALLTWILLFIVPYGVNVYADPIRFSFTNVHAGMTLLAASSMVSKGTVTSYVAFHVCSTLSWYSALTQYINSPVGSMANQLLSPSLITSLMSFASVFMRSLLGNRHHVGYPVLAALGITSLLFYFLVIERFVYQVPGWVAYFMPTIVNSMQMGPMHVKSIRFRESALDAQPSAGESAVSSDQCVQVPEVDSIDFATRMQFCCILAILHVAALAFMWYAFEGKEHGDVAGETPSNVDKPSVGKEDCNLQTNAQTHKPFAQGSDAPRAADSGASGSATDGSKHGIRSKADLLKGTSNANSKADKYAGARPGQADGSDLKEPEKRSVDHLPGDLVEISYEEALRLVGDEPDSPRDKGASAEKAARR
jgi:hypothetical protein